MGLFRKKGKSPLLFKKGQAQTMLTTNPVADLMQMAYEQWESLVPWRQKELVAALREKDAYSELIQQLGKPQYTKDSFLFWWQKLGQEAHFTQIVEQLAAKKPLQNQVAAIELLVALQDKRSLGPLLTALTQPLYYVPSRVAECLASLGQVASFGLSALYERSLPENKKIILSCLSYFPTYLPQDLLLSALTSAEEELQLAAIEVLQNSAKENCSFAKDALFTIFEAGSWRVKMATATLFSTQKWLESIAILRYAVQKEEDKKVLAALHIALQSLCRQPVEKTEEEIKEN